MPLVQTSFETPLGDMTAVASDDNLYLLEFIDRKNLNNEIAKLRTKTKEQINNGSNEITDSIQQELAGYFAGELSKFKTSIAMLGTEFQVAVWHQLTQIPHGKTIAYADLAIAIERPTAYRAVARANSTNQLAIIIPCHRVINSDGELGGYAGGINRKQWLLEHELAFTAYTRRSAPS